jgi:hypothetical protein
VEGCLCQAACKTRHRDSSRAEAVPHHVGDVSCTLPVECIPCVYARVCVCAAVCLNTDMFPLSLLNTLSHSHSLSLQRTLSLTHTYTRSLTHYPFPHALSRTLSNSLELSLSLSVTRFNEGESTRLGAFCCRSADGFLFGGWHGCGKGA